MENKHCFNFMQMQKDCYTLLMAGVHRVLWRKFGQEVTELLMKTMIADKE